MTAQVDTIGCPNCGQPVVLISTLPDLVGCGEIARRLSVRRQTVDMWRLRRRLPEPRWVIGGTPIWVWETIADWAKETGRLS